MTIYSRGYRDTSYAPTGQFARTWAIARHELAVIFRLRFGVILFILCLAPSVIQLGLLLVRVGIYEPVAEMRGRAAAMTSEWMNPAAPQFFLRPITTFGMLSVLVLTTLVSVRAIAKDRAAGALEIYWTRAISPWAYFFGKWYGSFLLLGAAIVAPTVVLWLTSVLMAPDWSQLDQTIGFVPGMLAGLVWLCAMLALLAVSLSAIAATPNLASIYWLLLFMGSLAFAEILRRILRESWLLALSPWLAGRRVVDACVGVQPFNDYSPWTAFACISGLALALLALAGRRLRVLDAVAT